MSKIKENRELCFLAKMDEARMHKRAQCQEKSRQVNMVLSNPRTGLLLELQLVFLSPVGVSWEGQWYRVKGGKDRGLV